MTYASPVYEATSVRSKAELMIKYLVQKGQEKKHSAKRIEHSDLKDVQSSMFKVQG